jgi:transcriptional regulator GlxA family with amidase domain
MPKNPQIPPVHHVEIIAFDGVQVLDITGPMQVFATANDLRAHAGEPPAYKLTVAARAPGSVVTSCGLAITAAGPSRRKPDTLLIPGGVGARMLAADRDVTRWLARRAGTVPRLVSVCTGAFLLAAGGLLDDRDATTHWAWCDALAREHPAIRVQRDALFVRAGHIWTSAGVTAGIDLALALLEADLGRAASLAVARQLVVFARRPGGQSQFSEALAAESLPEPFAALEAHVKANLRKPLTVADLAARAGMSERSFLRHWNHPTGCTPARWIERLRIEAAKTALARDRTPLKRVATRCGFNSEESLRRSFQRTVGVAPGAWRARFGRG